jgi:hypothetical protein
MKVEHHEAPPLKKQKFEKQTSFESGPNSKQTSQQGRNERKQTSPARMTQKGSLVGSSWNVTAVHESIISVQDLAQIDHFSLKQIKDIVGQFS